LSAWFSPNQRSCNAPCGIAEMLECSGPGGPGGDESYGRQPPRRR